MPEFQTLASLLRPQTADVANQPDKAEPAVEVQPPDRVQPEPPELEEAAREIRLFHAHVREALDRAVERLVCEIATDVVARELRLAPVEIERIVDRVSREFFAEEPIRVCLHPDDVLSVLTHDVALVADRTLRRGDVRLEVRNGSIDASLGVRLAGVVERALR
ncbi:MAG TPA: FliH/SctL family protein [Candidatus Baltobacteraceae bacterium]